MKKPKPTKPDAISAMLRSMPIDKRAETIVEIFRIIAAEFAAMVLEHVKPEPKPKRRPRNKLRKLMKKPAPWEKQP
jgi:hypothetical protein